MTSEDVVASLARWEAIRVRQGALRPVADWKALRQVHGGDEAQGESAIVLDLPGRANNFGAIYPKRSPRKYRRSQKAHGVHRYGPFKLAEWKPDQYIRMVRFDDTSPQREARKRSGAADRYVDESAGAGAEVSDPRGQVETASSTSPTT